MLPQDSASPFLVNTSRGSRRRGLNSCRFAPVRKSCATASHGEKIHPKGWSIDLSNTRKSSSNCRRTRNWLAGRMMRFEKPRSDMQGNLTITEFGTSAEGRRADLYTISNGRGAEVKVTNYGGIVASIKVPDRRGKLGEVVLGFNSLHEYLGTHPCYGATIGRYANRIAKARFLLSNREYRLAANDGSNHLHGGCKGFDKVFWEADPILCGENSALRLRYLSIDGEEGYPGNLSVSVTFSFSEDNALKIDYTATTDETTVLNLTNHSYFNLTDGGSSDILDHELQIEADCYLPIDREALPVGAVREVAGTAFDFRRSTAIGLRILDRDEQLLFGEGYNHTWVLREAEETPTHAA